jgi:hypothetical protein
VLASEMRYVMYRTTEARSPVPAAIVNVMALLANALLSKLRRTSAASALISNDMNAKESTSFRGVFMSIVRL